MLSYERRSRRPSLLASLGALLAAVAIGLAAYAAHGSSDALVQSRLQTASLYAFAHGAVLAVLGVNADRLLARGGLLLLLVGTALFSGSLVGAALWGWSTALAPVGGVSMSV